MSKEAEKDECNYMRGRITGRQTSDVEPSAEMGYIFIKTVPILGFRYPRKNKEMRLIPVVDESLVAMSS